MEPPNPDGSIATDRPGGVVRNRDVGDRWQIGGNLRTSHDPIFGLESTKANHGSIRPESQSMKQACIDLGEISIKVETWKALALIVGDKDPNVSCVTAGKEKTVATGDCCVAVTLCRKLGPGIGAFLAHMNGSLYVENKMAIP
ncbi:MAG: hypothetical protein AAF585_26635 [Verrucomicrobiota bacterium]